MEREGVKVLFSSTDMAVVGLTEVFNKLRTIFRASNSLKFILKKDRPDLLILIDYPDFNIHIARTAKRHKIPVLYYISPQVWAWRKSRVRKIARRIDRMAVILPFEKEFYRKQSFDVDYVGHPLLDIRPAGVNKSQVMLKCGMDQVYPVVGLLPGSRKEEIKNLLPVMIDSAEIMAKHYPDIHFVLPLAPGIEEALIQPYIKYTSLPIKFLREGVYEALSICDAAVVTSGTATLETAIMGIPMVIIYKISPISYWFGRMIVRVPHIGLVNLVAEKEVVPELIQNEVTAERLAHETMNILNNEEVRARMIKKLELIKEKLGRGGASEKTARIALEIMK